MVFCSISMSVAALVGAGVVGPDLLHELSDRFKAVVPDGTKQLETEAVVQWSGFIPSRERRGRPVPVEVFLYKAQKRLRIHLLTDNLTEEDADRATDAIADAFQATVVSRTYAMPPRGDPQKPAPNTRKRAATPSPTALRRTS